MKWYRLKDLRLALKEKGIYMTNRQITYELEKVFGKTENYHWQLTYNEYRVAIRSLMKKHRWRESVDYWGKEEGGQYMKSLNDWLMSRTKSSKMTSKPFTEYSGKPEYRMDYVVIDDEIITTITKDDEVWYETHTMYNLGYKVHSITDSHLAYFGGKNNVYNCGYNFGSFCKVREDKVKTDPKVVELTPKELYHRALNNRYSDAHYKKLVAIFLACEALKKAGKHFFVPYRGRKLKINPEIKKLASEVSYYAVNTFNNRLVMFYIIILIDWGLIECNLDEIDRIVIK